MTETEIKENWYYFRSLAKQFQETEQYVDHSIDDDGKLLKCNGFIDGFRIIFITKSLE